MSDTIKTTIVITSAIAQYLQEEAQEIANAASESEQPEK